jgi:hypothetical protein
VEWVGGLKPMLPRIFMIKAYGVVIKFVGHFHPSLIFEVSVIKTRCLFDIG